MSGLVDLVRQATLPTPDEEWALRATAPASLLRTAAAALTAEPGELEHVLREAPRGRGGRRWGKVPDPVAMPASTRRGGPLLAAAALAVGLVGVGGLAEAAGSIDALQALVLPGGGLDAFPDVPEESASCQMPEAPADEPVARRDKAPGSGGAGGGRTSVGPTLGEVAASVDALTLLQTRNPHPNPRLVRIASGEAAALTFAAKAVAEAKAGAAPLAVPGSTGPAPAGAGGAPQPPNASGTAASAAPAATVPTGGSPAFVSVAPSPSPMGGDAPRHTVNALPSELPADLGDALTTCPVWPGEPGEPVFSRPAGAPPPLDPVVVAIAPPMAAPALQAPRAPSAPVAPSGGSAVPAPSSPAAPVASSAPAAPSAPAYPSMTTPSGLTVPVAAVTPSTAGFPAPVAAPSAPAAPAAQPAPSAPSAIQAVIWGNNLGEGPPPLPECEPDGSDSEE